MQLHGVRVNHLKNISVDIPLHQLTVLTGISGSGKSSLAFDTLFAEGQRRLLETLPLGKRSRIQQLERPQADRMEGIPPAFIVRQRGADLPPGLSLGQWSGLGEILAELFIREGTESCPQCHQTIRIDDEQSALQQVNQLTAGTRFQIAFEVEAGSKSQQKALQESLLAMGFARLFTATRSVHHEAPVKTTRKKTTKRGASSSNMQDMLIVVVDRFISGKFDLDRFVESLNLAFREGQGAALLLLPTENEISANDGQTVETVTDEKGQPWRVLTLRQFPYCETCHKHYQPVHVLSLLESMQKSESGKTDTDQATVTLKWNDLSWEQIWKIPFAKLRPYFEQASTSKSLHPLLVTLSEQINSLQRLGIGYLTLQRPLESLSVGEAQRLGLARALQTGFVNTLFILDEPCAGCFQNEVDAVCQAVRQLTAQGNTVVVVEHHTTMIQQADHVIDLGPGAGAAGGEVLFAGTTKELLASESSVTAQWLREPDIKIQPSPHSPRWQSNPDMKLTGISVHNLQIDQLTIPLQRLVIIAGPSGSGKSSLVRETIYRALCQSRSWEASALPQSSDNSVLQSWESIEGADQFDECVLMTSEMRQRYRQQILINGMGIFDEVRSLFAQTHTAKMRHYTAGDFSLHGSRSRKCPRCGGRGVIEMRFPPLSPVQMNCPECLGQRYQPEICEILYRGHSIPEVLEMTVEEAFLFFRNLPKIQKGLFALKEAGLEYVTLGRSLKTLSGGEYQRFLMALCLLKRGGQRTLFLLDEPSTGLHPANIQHLAQLFFHLLELGHSLVVIDHDLHLIRLAEHLIELGPIGENDQSGVVAVGTMAEVKASSISRLKQWL